MSQEQFRTVEGRFKVYFSCRGCGTIYSASQERSSTPASGLFSCLTCGKPVHHWSGIYDYTDWKRVFKA
ncbi:transcription elongation factor Elf1 [Bradyrhizobium sp. JR3.5]